MTPEIGDSFSALRAGGRPTGLVADWPLLPRRDRPEIADHTSAIRGVLISGPNRGSGFPNFGAFLATPIAARK